MPLSVKRGFVSQNGRRYQINQSVLKIPFVAPPGSLQARICRHAKINVRRDAESLCLLPVRMYSKV